MNNKRGITMDKKIVEKAIVYVIVGLFIVGACSPAVSSVRTNVANLATNPMITANAEESLGYSGGTGYGALVNWYLQTAIVGVVSVAFNSPLLSQIREFFTGKSTSDDGGTNDDRVNPIDVVYKTSQEQDADLLPLHDPPLPLNTSDPWWNDDWLYRKEITIDRTKVAVLLQLPGVDLFPSDADLASKAQSDGDDHCFYK